MAFASLVARAGLPVPAIRPCVTPQLIAPLRNAGGHRRYNREDIRRLLFGMIAPMVGVCVGADWTVISPEFGREIDLGRAGLMQPRDKLKGCIGCIGCKMDIYARMKGLRQS